MILVLVQKHDDIVMLNIRRCKIFKSRRFNGNIFLIFKSQTVFMKNKNRTSIIFVKTLIVDICHFSSSFHNHYVCQDLCSG